MLRPPIYSPFTLDETNKLIYNIFNSTLEGTARDFKPPAPAFNFMCTFAFPQQYQTKRTWTVPFQNTFLPQFGLMVPNDLYHVI